MAARVPWARCREAPASAKIQNCSSPSRRRARRCSRSARRRRSAAAAPSTHARVPPRLAERSPAHPAQRDDDAAVAFPGVQNNADHGNAFLRQQQGGVLTQRQSKRSQPAQPATPQLRLVRRGIGSRPAVRAGPGAGWSVLERVLDLRPGLLGVALDLVTAAFGLQAVVAGGAAGGLLGAAFDRFGLVRDLLSDTHGGLPFVSHSAGADAPTGTSGAGWPFSVSGCVAGASRGAGACRGADLCPNKCSLLQRLSSESG